MHATVGARTAIVCLIAGATGCITGVPVAKPTHNSNVAGRGDLQCRVERPTGSLLDVRICTTQAQRDRIKANTQAVKQDLGNVQVGPCPPQKLGC